MSGLPDLPLSAEDRAALEETYGPLTPSWYREARACAAAFATGRWTDPPPTCAPWNQIYTARDPQQGFLILLEGLSRKLQIALSAVLSVALPIGDPPDPPPAPAPDKPTRRPTTSETYIEELTRLGYSFTLNELDDAIEVNGVRLDDILAAQIRTQMRDAGHNNVRAIEDAYTAEAARHRYHPVRRYLEGLPPVEGEPIARLASFFTDDHRHFATWLRRWLIGAVARAYQPCQNRVLVLDGPQGVGKSFFARWLAKGLPSAFIQGAIDPRNKDMKLRLASAWIWEVAELGHTVRRADKEALKQFLTLEIVTVRPPYGRRDIRKPALASFIGTANNEFGLLDDPTGARRFMIARISAIDWRYAEALSPDAVWAEAYQRYRQGEPWELTPEERAIAAEINVHYGLEDPLENLLQRHFELDPQATDRFAATDEILGHLYARGWRGNGNSRRDAMQLATVLTQLGIKRARRTVRGVRLSGYVGVTLRSYPTRPAGPDHTSPI